MASRRETWNELAAKPGMNMDLKIWRNRKKLLILQRKKK